MDRECLNCEAITGKYDYCEVCNEDRNGQIVLLLQGLSKLYLPLFIRVSKDLLYLSDIIPAATSLGLIDKDFKEVFQVTSAKHGKQIILSLIHTHFNSEEKTNE